MSRRQPDWDPPSIDAREDPQPIYSPRAFDQLAGDVTHADEQLRATQVRIRMLLDQLSAAETRADLAEEACDRARGIAVALEHELADSTRALALLDEHIEDLWGLIDHLGTCNCGECDDDWAAIEDTAETRLAGKLVEDVDTGGRI